MALPGTPEVSGCPEDNFELTHLHEFPGIDRYTGRPETQGLSCVPGGLSPLFPAKTRDILVSKAMQSTCSLAPPYNIPRKEACHERFKAADF